VNRKEPIVSIGEVSNVFRNYATNIDKNTVKLGIDSIDKQIRLQSNSHVVIAGCSGSGKTTVVLNILNNTSQSGLKSVFFSMDMGAQLIYQKLAHKVSGLNDKQLYTMYQQKREKEIAAIDNTIADNYKNVLFDFRAGVSIDDLRENVLRLKDQHGDSLKLVVSDFINRIRGPYAEETSNLAYIAPRLADLANESETLIISLAQTARSKGGPAQPLQDSRIAKGSSAIEESASVLLGIYRNGYNTDQDKFLTIAALKTRMGKEFVQPLYWNGLTGEIRDLNSDEEFELDRLEEAKKKDEKTSSYD
jgi:replicative DNA helicase